MSQVMFIPSSLRRLLGWTLTAFIMTLAITPARADVDEVMKRIHRDGHAKVLVRMKADSGSSAWSARQTAPRQRAAVAAALENVQPSLRRARIASFRSFRTLPLMATDVTQEQLLSLMTSNEVESIFLVRKERKLDNAIERAQIASSVASIDAAAAWAKGYDGSGYAVAVIDDGFNLNHPMLLGKSVGDACFASDFDGTTKNNCPSGVSPQIGPGAASNCPANGTRCGHGTHIASIAVGNDGVNFGVARGAKLVPIDVFSTDTNVDDCSPDPAPCQLTDSLAVLDALDYINEHAVELKIAAVNISIGGAARDGYCDDDPRKGVIDMLRQKGIAVAIAAGNNGLTGKINAPACISSAFGVGATNDGTTVANFSNFASILDFMAPGVDVTAASGSGSGPATLSGTSVAAPHVAGAWAVMRSAIPNGQFDELEQALKQSGANATRQDSGIRVPKIQVASAINRLLGKDRRVMNNLVSSLAPGMGESYLRLFNASPVAGTVTVTLRDVASGAVLGTWTSPRIPAHAAPQIGIGVIEANATPTNGLPLNLGARTYYNLDVTSTFAGHMQHVLWTRIGGVFANLTSCAGGYATDTTTVPNVHASSIETYVSRLRIVNTGATNDYPRLTIYDANTGAEIAQWAGPVIAAGGSLEIRASQLEDQLGELKAAVSRGLLQYNVSLSNLTGYVQHVIENSGVGALVDMTSKCDLGLTAASSAASPEAVSSTK